MWRIKSICPYSAENTLRYNLFGLELDERACAAAETALRLKAAEFGASAAPQVFDFAGVNGCIGSLTNGDELEVTDDKTAKIGQLLKQKYTIIVTNPPYLGKSAMNCELSEFTNRYYGGCVVFRYYVAELEDYYNVNSRKLSLDLLRSKS